MNRNDLIAARRSQARRLWLGFVVFAAAALCTIPFVIRKPEVFRNEDGLLDIAPISHLQETVVPVLLIFTVAFAVFLVILLKGSRSLSCPHCRRTLLGRATGVVMASGSCPFCGFQVLEEDARNKTSPPCQ